MRGKWGSWVMVRLVDVCCWWFYVTSTTSSCVFFFFNDPATTEIYTLSLHDALPI